jgi:hypothetical protein
VPAPFGINDILGWRVELIGQRTGMPVNGLAQNVFDTGDIAYRAGGGRVVIAWIIVSLENAAGAFDGGVTGIFGSLAVPNDWSGATNAILLGGVTSPAMLYPNLGLDAGGAVLPIPFYAPQTPFTATYTATGSPSSQTYTTSCYGWSEN